MSLKVLCDAEQMPDCRKCSETPCACEMEVPFDPKPLFKDRLVRQLNRFLAEGHQSETTLRVPPGVRALLDLEVAELQGRGYYVEFLEEDAQLRVSKYHPAP